MKVLLFASVTALAVVAGACGSSNRVLTERTLLNTIREGGFSNLAVLSSKKELSQLAKTLGNPEIDKNPFVDYRIYVRGTSPVYGPLGATWFPTIATAKRADASDQTVLHGTAPPAVLNALPPGLDVNRIRQVRICNVVISTYSRSPNAALTHRFERVLNLLRARC